MAVEEPPYDGKFTYYKHNDYHPKNSLCFKNESTDIESCHGMNPCSDDGLLLPIFFEETWSVSFRIIVYLVGLLYSFLGVSIVADIFMCSIEKITSKTKTIYLSSATAGGVRQTLEVQVWNSTVANLTLMALGSSAPEILLSIIEIVGNKFKAGELGPGTIVGSAAFNLMVISAVCVLGIPKGETRRIDRIGVFAVTASFSIFAYLWLIVVLKLSSPNRIDIWEALLTLLFFPALVCIAYAADKRWLHILIGKRVQTVELDEQRQIELGNSIPPNNRNVQPKNYFRHGQLDNEGIVNFIKDIKKNTNLSDEDAAVLAASKIIDSKSHSRMWYRIGAIRDNTGGRKLYPRANMNDKLKKVYNAINENPECPNINLPEESKENAIIEFQALSAAVLENIGTYKIFILRHGNMNEVVKVRLQTVDGAAVEGEDYEAIDEILTFRPHETKKEIGITIVDDNQWEPDEEFFLKLTIIPGEDNEHVKLGKRCIMEITILNDDEPGHLQFEKRGYLLKESCVNAEVGVVRENGADGNISVKWRTLDKSAVSGKDYTQREGEIRFTHGETHQIIYIPIVNDMALEKDVHFEIELFEPKGGAEIGKMKRTAITVTNDDDFHSVLHRTLLLTHVNVDRMRVHSNTWAQQLSDAMNVNGGDIKNATLIDYIMHFLTFGFKMIFALIPPPGIAGGWPCFLVSLGMIGILTAIVGDLANIFGCLIGLRKPVTAITFVALGTSLPDTFASKAAAVGEKTADNAIGNITGSNAVNVFLGLGTPWLIASIYHHVVGTEGGFEMTDPSLTFSVTIFTIFAVTIIVFLMVRRNVEFFGKSELGGPQMARRITFGFFTFLWLLYVLLASLQAYDIIEGF